MVRCEVRHEPDTGRLAFPNQLADHRQPIRHVDTTRANQTCRHYRSQSDMLTLQEPIRYADTTGANQTYRHCSSESNMLTLHEATNSQSEMSTLQEPIRHVDTTGDNHLYVDTEKTHFLTHNQNVSFTFNHSHENTSVLCSFYNDSTDVHARPFGNVTEQNVILPIHRLIITIPNVPPTHRLSNAYQPRWSYSETRQCSADLHATYPAAIYTRLDKQSQSKWIQLSKKIKASWITRKEQLLSCW